MQSFVLAAAAACLAAFANAQSSPEQFHLALAGDGEMRISFKLNSSAPQTCSYASASANFTSSASEVRSYFPNGGYYHHVLLQGLAYASPYTYSCAGSPAFPFVSAPAAGVFAPFQMAVFGDWGYKGSKERGPSIPTGGLSSNWSATPVRELLESLKDAGAIQMIQHSGDISYSDDAFGEHPLKFGYEEITDEWFSWIQNLSATMPYHISVGNHESECHSPSCILNLESQGLHLNNFSAYKNRWEMNNKGSGGVQNMWYSYRRSGVHFVSLDTETDWDGAEESTTGDGHFPFLPAGSFGAPGQYMAWLAADLAAAAADPSVRWIIASGHRPFEDLPPSHSAALVALFKAAGVAMYQCGHGHTYIRYGVDAFGDGAVHIMPGGSGSDETPWPKDQAVAPTEDVQQRCAAWCTAFDQRANATAAAAAAAGQGAGQHVGRSACTFCKSTLGLAPVATSDLYSAGFIDVQHDTLTFKLLRAPDGAVLDSIVITHA